jgi:hypothetical protein
MNYLIPPPPLARASYKTSFTIQHNSHYCLKTTCWGCGSKARQGFLNEVPPRDRSFTVMTQLMHLHLVCFAGRRSRIRGWRLELVLSLMEAQVGHKAGSCATTATSSEAADHRRLPDKVIMVGDTRQPAIGSTRKYL